MMAVTDKSIPPVMSTTVCPVASRSSGRHAMRMFERLSGDAKPVVNGAKVAKRNAHRKRTKYSEPTNLWVVRSSWLVVRCSLVGRESSDGVKVGIQPWGEFVHDGLQCFDLRLCQQLPFVGASEPVFCFIE